MAVGDADKLEAGLAKLKKGLSLTEVKSRLGTPTWERTYYTKALFGGGKFISKNIAYVLKRVDKDGQPE
jgi:hypothetical protein